MQRTWRWLVLAVCLCSCVETRAQKPPPVVAIPAPQPPPAPEAPPASPMHQPAPAAPFTIQLIDRKTREIMAGVSATIISDNGIRCVRAPCPNKQRTWEGRADAEGGVHVPADMVDQVMTVMVHGYQPATIRRDTGERPKRVVSVHLVPEDLNRR